MNTDFLLSTKILINTKDPVHVILERHGFTNYKLVSTDVPGALRVHTYEGAGEYAEITVPSLNTIQSSRKIRRKVPQQSLPWIRQNRSWLFRNCFLCEDNHIKNDPIHA